MSVRTGKRGQPFSVRGGIRFHGNVKCRVLAGGRWSIIVDQFRLSGHADRRSKVSDGLFGSQRCPKCLGHEQKRIFSTYLTIF